MRKSLIALLILLLALPIAFTAAQPPPLTLEISGINPQAFPTVLLTADVYDRLGQPLRGLSESSFTLTGDLSATTRITRVENITDDNLPFGAVLVIDVSSSMAGLPLERAKTAAQAFIDSLRPDDPVALMTFGSDVQLVQDFTTDRTALSASIAALQWGGQTALYQAAFEAINVAANARLPRRAVVLLSDGAEFGDLSQVGRSAALTESTVRGVPLYTIGLGYGIDRSYLIELSEGTNAQFYESPSPDQLVGIYQELAARFRSQYILTLETTIPGDGTTYILGLTANSAEGSASAEAAFRAPIPVPIVRILDAPAGEVAEPASLTIEVLADDPLATVAVNDGSSEMILVDFASPYSISIDPMAYEPGMQTFTVSARDDDGDVGTAQVNVWIAAPTATPITPTATPTSTATPSATPTLTHTPTPTLTPTPMPSATNTPTPMPVVEDTPAPTETVVAVAQVASPQPSNTPRPTLTITVTPDLRATANALATLNAATAESQAVQTASAATQSAQAQQATAVAATQAAQFVQTAVAQTEVAATQSAQLAATVIAQTQIAATQAAQLAQTAAAQTQSAATVIAQVTRTAIASATQAAATLAAQLTATAAQQATQTAIVEATQDAIALATGEARATQLAGVQATQTAGVQATADARASAVATVPAAPTRTPTMTPVPPLREITTENPPTVADLLPLLCLAGVVALVLVVVFVLMGGRRRQRK